MKWTGIETRANRVVNIYEVVVWVIYAWLFKYSHYLEARKFYPGYIPVPRSEIGYFPQLEVGWYALAMTLYVIPFYRWIAPALLRRKRYFWLFISVLLYFVVVTKLTNWVVSGIFEKLYPSGLSSQLFHYEHELHTWVMKSPGGEDLQILLTDIIAFLSITFMRFAMDNEQKRHLLERDNLVLQLESLRAQLHPHFLFNTLNSIYGMSLTGSPDTPGFILKLSEMMRFILYDCRSNAVPLEKDIEFLENYIAMEKKRYPLADISFNVSGPGRDRNIAPLLFIPFVENCFKHGSHRVTDSGSIEGHLKVEKDKLRFVMENDVLPDTRPNTPYGGVGIENVRRRLELYYPGQHTLVIENDQRIFRVSLTIAFKD